MVSLQKNRGFVPVHLMSEEATQAQIAAIEIKASPNVPAVQTAYTAETVNNDLTALTKTELCALMKKTADKMTADYALVERITAEAQRRASTEDHGSEDYWGDVDYFQNGLAEKIINGHKQYKKRHRFEDGFDFAVALIKGLILVGIVGGALFAILILLDAFFALLA